MLISTAHAAENIHQINMWHACTGSITAADFQISMFQFPFEQFV